MTDRITVERTLTQAEFDLFARLSGDDNPIHVDPDFSSRTRFGRTVAHGMLLSTILRGLAGRLVPGWVQVAQDLRFPAPTFTDEPMLFEAWMESRADGLADVGLRATRVADGAVTCDGRASMIRAGSAS